MASRTPFLTTVVGNAKEIVEWSSAGILLPTKNDKVGFSHVRVEDAAKILDEIVSSPSKRRRLANNGFMAWKKQFSWEVIAESYLYLYQKGKK